MAKRYYFLTSEIVPFAETYELATFSKEFPNVFIERKEDFRVMMPKYEFISERRYILREVIRLREMEVEFRGMKLKAAVKSAFIPNTKVQVYFLENENYYSPKDPEQLYEEVEDNEDTRNYNRFGYFAVSSLVTLEYLRWKPEIIICNDWQMALLPFYLRKGLVKNDFASEAKLVYVVHSRSEKALYPIDFFEQIGVKDMDDKFVVNGKVDISLLAMSLADNIIFVDIQGTNSYSQYSRNTIYKKVTKGKPVTKLSVKDVEDPDEWQKVADEFAAAIE